MKELQFYSGNYTGLIDATRSAPCAEGPITNLYDVTLTGLTPWTSDAANGALGQRGWDIDFNIAVADAAVGKLNFTARSIDWLNHHISTGMAIGTPAITNLRGIGRHLEGVNPGAQANLWFWGDDATTSTTARLVRCSWTTCLLCPDPPVTCVYEQALAAANYAGVVAYQQSNETGFSYGGVVAAFNVDNGFRQISSDGSGAAKEYTPNNNERQDTGGSWNGGLLIGGGRTLFFGNGVNNLMQCNDPPYSGDPDCSLISGVPNQAQRAYYDAALAPNGAVLLLASSCLDFCVSSSSYLVALAYGLDPTVGSNWKEFPIASSSALGGQHVAQVAAGDDSIMLLGTQDRAPYVFHFTP